LATIWGNFCGAAWPPDSRTLQFDPNIARKRLNPLEEEIPMSVPLLRYRNQRQEKQKRFDVDRFLEKLERRFIRIAVLVSAAIMFVAVLIREIQVLVHEIH
jgi:hypothetical protein